MNRRPTAPRTRASSTARAAAPDAARASRAPAAARPAAPSGARRPAAAARGRSARPDVVAPRGRAVKIGVLALLAVVCLVSVLAPLTAFVRQRSDLADLGRGVAASTTRVDALQAEVDRWQDPAYVSAQARARLHYVVPGETGYVVLDAPAEAGTTPVTATTDDAAAQGSWYASLWQSTTVAGLDGAQAP